MDELRQAWPLDLPTEPGDAIEHILRAIRCGAYSRVIIGVGTPEERDAAQLSMYDKYLSDYLLRS